MKKHTEIGFNLFLLVVAIGAYRIASGYKYMQKNGQIGAGFIPVWASIILAVANVLNIILILAKPGYGEEGKFFKNKQSAKNIILFTAMVVIYMFGIMNVGMYVSTAVFMICVYKFFDKMPWKNTLLVSGGTLLFIWLVFGKMLNMRFPSGWLI